MKKKLATVMAATMAVSGSVVSVSAATTNEQLVGADRADTAVKISKDGWKSAETVILVNDSAIPDALTATPLAYAKNAPILLTAKGGLTKATANEIKRLGAKDVIMIGGDAVLPAKIENELKALKVKTDRVKGSTREETALAIAKRLDGIKDISEIAVVNGTTGLADAVSVAAAAAEKGMPILLANPKSGLSAVEKFINSESIKTSFVIGGDEAVSDEAIAKLPGKQRIEGSDRNDTNAKVIEKFYADKELDNLYLAKDGMENSGQLIDALAVGALAAKNGAPVLIASKKLNANQVNVVNTKKIATITQVGGEGNEKAFNELKEIEKAEVIKVKNEAELQEALKKANANDTIEIDANATISKDVTLSTNNAIEINVKGDLTGKVTVKTPNADIKNSGTIGTLVVENGKNTTVTNTSAGKISKVEVSSSSENVKVENNGTITEVKNDGEGTKVENDGTISKPITGTETPNVEGNKPGGSTGGGGSSSGGGSTNTELQPTVKNVAELKAAVANDEKEIVLKSGEYKLDEPLNVSGKTVTIKGQSGTKIIKADGNAVFYNYEKNAEQAVVKNDGLGSDTKLTVSGIEFVGNTGTGNNMVIVTAYGANNTEFKFDNCKFTNLYTPVYYNPVKDSNINKLSITNCTYNNTSWGYSVDYISQIESTNPSDINKQNVTFTGNTGIAEDREKELFGADGTYIKGDGKLSNDGGTLKATFNWNSLNGVGTNVAESDVNGLNYYKDGVYLRLQVTKVDGDDKGVKTFNDVFKTAKDDDNTHNKHKSVCEDCGLTLKTIIDGNEAHKPTEDDKEGSLIEKADWKADINYYSTKLDNSENDKYIFYGVRQNKDKGTRTVGFKAGDERKIELVLRPKLEANNGTYTVTIQLMQQMDSERNNTSDKVLGDKITYTFNVNNGAITVNE